MFLSWNGSLSDCARVPDDGMAVMKRNNVSNQVIVFYLAGMCSDRLYEMCIEALILLSFKSKLSSEFL